MPYTSLFYYDLRANAFQRWNKIRLNNDGLRHNKTIESFSSSHSPNQQCMMLESWDVLFLSLSDTKLLCKNKPKIGNFTEKQAQNVLAEKFNKTKNQQQN